MRSLLYSLGAAAFCLAVLGSAGGSERSSGERLPPYASVSERSQPDEPVAVDIWWLTDFQYEEGGQLPERIARLNGKPVVLTGYMHTFQKPQTGTFLMVDDGCACGGRPQVNRFVEVTLADDATTPYRPGLLDVSGVLEVKEKRDEDGFVVSLFRLKGEFY